MAQPYVGEIRMFAGNFAPAGWMFCEGQLLPISENETLFQLIGTTYGGDGQRRSPCPTCAAVSRSIRATASARARRGAPRRSRSPSSRSPSHGHALLGSTAPSSGTNPTNSVFAHLPDAGVQTAYGTTAPFGAIDPSSVAPAGGTQPHDNIQPYCCVNFIISLFGIFPPPT